MSITVREAMEIGGLKHCKVVAGEKGLDRIIDHVTVMEIPDVVEWLRGNDFLLTSLLPIKDDKRSLNTLVSKLYDSGSAALAVKNRFFDEFPNVLIQEANRLNFPVIELEKDIAYLDIITPLMKNILLERNLNQDNVEEFFNWITELALSGKGLETLVQAVESFVINPLSIEAEIPLINEINNNEVTPLNFTQIRELKNSKRPMRIVRKIRGKKIPSLVSPISLNEEIFGYITLWEIERKFRKVDLVVIERLVSLFALEFLKIKTKIDVELEYKSELLYDILIGRIDNERDLIEKARLFKWDLTLDYRIVVLDIDDFQSVVKTLNSDELRIKNYKNKILKKIESILVKNSIVTLASDRIIICYPYVNTTQDSFSNFLKQLQMRIKKTIKGITISVGIGGFYTGLKGMHFGYEEALKAINIGRIVWGKGQMINFDDLGVYRLLNQVENKNELELFSEEIRCLINYDKKNNTELIYTLSQYFNNNYSMSDTATNLFIHINTLKYRLERIETITSLSIHLAEDRLKLHLGLKIISFLY